MEETQQQKDVIESSDINELEEIFARKTGQPVPQKIVVPQKPKIETPVQQPQAPIIQPTAPIVKETVQVKPQPEIKPPIVEVKTSQDTEFTPMFEQNTPPSLDKMMQYHLDQQKKNIDDEAALKKKNVETLFFNNMIYLINLAASGKPLQQQLPEQVSEPTKVYVKDNADALKVIDDNVQFVDLQILDPNTHDLEALIKVKENLLKKKAELQGLPYNTPVRTDNIKYSNKEAFGKPDKVPKEQINNPVGSPKKEYSFWKIVVPSATALGVIAFGLIYALSSGLVHL